MAALSLSVSCARENGLPTSRACLPEMRGCFKCEASGSSWLPEVRTCREEEFPKTKRPNSGRWSMQEAPSRSEPRQGDSWGSGARACAFRKNRYHFDKRFA